jgi:hypothetical protein
MTKQKIRLRICLKDIYRYIAIGEDVEILGIYKWRATKTGILVVYENGRRKTYKATTEDDLKNAIKIINKYISEVR